MMACEVNHRSLSALGCQRCKKCSNLARRDQAAVHMPQRLPICYAMIGANVSQRTASWKRIDSWQGENR
jgi:hypothetical protein